MTLADEYANQNIWRNWTSYLKMLAIDERDTILDLGCGTGHVSRLFSEKVLKVISIDANTKLLEEARKIKNGDNIDYINQDLRKIDYNKLPLVDGIWASFVTAYFPDFSHVLKSWLKCLKPNGWIALVEINDLFAHYPLSKNTHEGFKKFYELERNTSRYDYEMGSKLRNYLNNENLSITSEEKKYDKELSFNGAAEEQILKAWENRFNRLLVLREFFGKDKYSAIKLEFLSCLAKKNHTSKSEVIFIVAKKKDLHP